MNRCKCGSYAINDDPDGVLCDVCLVKVERDLLLLAVSSVGGDLDLLLKSAPGGLPSTRQMEAWRDELADAWLRSKGGDVAGPLTSAEICNLTRGDHE